MLLVDANVILRHLLNDIPNQSQIAKEAINSGASTEVEIIAEDASMAFFQRGLY